MKTIVLCTMQFPPRDMANKGLGMQALAFHFASLGYNVRVLAADKDAQRESNTYVAQDPTQGKITVTFIQFPVLTDIERYHQWSLNVIKELMKVKTIDMILIDSWKFWRAVRMRQLVDSDIEPSPENVFVDDDAPSASFPLVYRVRNLMDDRLYENSPEKFPALIYSEELKAIAASDRIIAATKYLTKKVSRRIADHHSCTLDADDIEVAYEHVKSLADHASRYERIPNKNILTISKMHHSAVIHKLLTLISDKPTGDITTIFDYFGVKRKELKLTVVGSLMQESKICATVADKGITPSSLQFISEKISPSGIAKLMQESCMMISSRYNVEMDYSVAQGLSVGMPIITSSTGCMTELTENPELEFVSILDLAEKICTVLGWTDEQILEESNRAKKAWLKFSKESHVLQMSDILIPMLS